MQWSSVLAAIGDVAAGAMIRVVSDRPPRRLRYGLPLLLITGTTGLTLLLPGFIGRGVFDLLLLPVLVVALGLGLAPALATVALTAGIVPLAFAPPGSSGVSDPFHLTALALQVVEGMMLAFIGAVTRAAIRAALSGGDESEDRVPASPRDPVAVGPLRVERLTPREAEVLRLAASGRSVDDLAAELYVSPNTVKTHLAHCYDKLGASNRTEAVAIALRTGALEASDLQRSLEATLAGAS